MAQDRIKGEIIFYCDGPGCQEVLETGAHDFAEANEARRDARWIAAHDQGNWSHYCSRSCQDAGEFS